MVDEYALWYDRHADPAWRGKLWPAEGDKPHALCLPRSADDLRAIGKSFAATTFQSAGNVTHTPAYGHLIALGIETTVRAYGRFPTEIANAMAYRQSIADTGRFLTFCSGAPSIGRRLNPDPNDRIGLKIEQSTDAGLVLTGKIGMHTSPAYAEDVYVGAGSGLELDGHRVTFVVPISAPGATVFCRGIAVREDSRFSAPWSTRFDELDGQLWLDKVLVPWNRIFRLDANIDPIAKWLFWHQLYCWLSKAEVALGLALACADALALTQHQTTIDLLMDIVTDVQTVRTCIAAAELDPQFTPEGYCYPNHNHIAAGSIAMLRARQRIAETLRILPGSSLVVAPTDTDIADPALAAALEDAFGGAGYSAAQRSALLQAARDHVSSALDGRESAFELHANGGIPTWRGRLRRTFEDYNTLANAVTAMLSIPMPTVDFTAIKEAPLAPRRVVVPTR